MQSSWFVAKYFLFNCFPGWLSMAAPKNKKAIVNVIKLIESVINKFDRKRKSYRSYWFCQISAGFTVFCKKF